MLHRPKDLDPIKFEAKMLNWSEFHEGSEISGVQAKIKIVSQYWVLIKMLLWKKQNIQNFIKIFQKAGNGNVYAGTNPRFSTPYKMNKYYLFSLKFRYLAFDREHRHVAQPTGPARKLGVVGGHSSLKIGISLHSYSYIVPFEHSSSNPVPKSIFSPEEHTTCQDGRFLFCL